MFDTLIYESGGNMKTKKDILDAGILDQEFEYIGLIEEHGKLEITIKDLWGKSPVFTPPQPVKKFNKVDIKILEDKMKKEGKL